MGLYSIVEPVVGTNLVLNPSAEQPGNFANHNGATVTQSPVHARYGAQCYSIVTGAVNRGINLTLQALANAIHYVTFYARRDAGPITGNLEVSLNGGTNYNVAAIISGVLSDSGSRWVRYGVQISAAQANGSTAAIIRNTVNEGFYIDAVQVEQNTVPTTYIDGDRAGLYRWNGLRSGSTSTRDAQERGGGRERDLAVDYGVIVDPATQNYGYPETTLNFFPQPLQPGSLFQSDKLGMRELILQLTFGTTTGPAVTYQSMLQQRKNFLALVRGAQYRGRQPFTLRSTAANANKPLYAPFRYKDGMRGGPQRGFSEETPVRIISEQPFWFEDDNQAKDITLQQAITSNRAQRRINGLWQGLGSGFNGGVNAIAVDAQRGRIYFGGDFTTANGVTVNGICYWNGSTFVAMGSGISGGAATVLAIAIAPNGDVWIGGDFTTVNGAASNNYIARWNLSLSTWTTFGATVPTGSVRALAVTSTGLLYAGGTFLNWNADGNADYIVTYNGSTWSALGTANLNGAVRGLTISQSGLVYAIGEFTTAGATTLNRVGVWNGTAWAALGGGLTGGATPTGLAIIAGPDGTIYACGQFTTAGGNAASNIAAWNGSSWKPLGSGLAALGNAMAFDSSGLLYVVGQFTSAGGNSAATKMAVWNGSAWAAIDADFSSMTGFSVATYRNDLYTGFDTSTSIIASAQTTVTNLSTTETYPVCYVFGPTTGSLTLLWLENQSTGDRLYFNLTVNAGEIVTIDLRPNRRQVISDWRGAINSQPLSGSDFNSFELLPGGNVIAAFASGTLTGASLRMHYQPVHDSIDGVA